jgi:hypothetical protein
MNVHHHIYFSIVEDVQSRVILFFCQVDAHFAVRLQTTSTCCGVVKTESGGDGYMRPDERARVRVAHEYTDGCSVALQSTDCDLYVFSYSAYIDIWKEEKKHRLCGSVYTFDDGPNGSRRARQARVLTSKCWSASSRLLSAESWGTSAEGQTCTPSN